MVQAHGLGWPLVVKPAEQGGSWGVSVVDGPDRLADAVGAAQQYTRAQPHGLELDTRALLQEYIPGAEYSCDTVVAGGVAYPLPRRREGHHRGPVPHRDRAHLPLRACPIRWSGRCSTPRRGRRSPSASATGSRIRR
ncbi:ATP-grasp domain-containing protein [Streptomyces avidinii]